MRADQPKRPRRGFTLVEILVVISIILIASVVALPTLVSSLNGRQVVDGAGILTGALAGARDSAIRQNEPRGIRLMPDPTMTIPALGTGTAGSQQLAYNRMVPIEPAPDYAEGKINIGPQLPFGSAFPTAAGFPPPYPRPTAANQAYPFFPTNLAVPSKVLMVEESLYAGGFAWLPGIGGYPNSPTNWYWNIRVGDKIKIGGSGRAYTIVGPCTVNPWGSGANQGNPELFVNVGPPGTQSPLARTYCVMSGTATTPVFTSIGVNYPEFLFLVNGEDDDHDGMVDAGWDGHDGTAAIVPGSSPAMLASPPNNAVDDLGEWETETWVSANVGDSINDFGSLSGTTSPTNFGPNNWLEKHWQSAVVDMTYSIQRRPVPTPGAREVLLPAGVVIDATTTASVAAYSIATAPFGTNERSRLPVQPGSLYIDIMLNPNGLYIPTTAYSTPTTASPTPFLHFWVADRNDVYPVGSVWGAGNANPSNSAGAYYYNLPMTTDAGGAGYPPSTLPNAPVLKNDRRLVTLFGQSGMVVTNLIETVPWTQGSYFAGEGFDTRDVSMPFYHAQLGQREVK